MREEEELPLLSESEILSTIRTQPAAATPQESFWSKHRLPLAVGTASLATAAAVFGVVFLTPDSTVEVNKKLANNDQIVFALPSTDQESEPVSNSIVEQTELKTNPVEDGAVSRSAAADGIAPTSEQTDPLVSTLEFSEAELNRLGLEVDGRTIIYREDGHVITVSTAGVAVLGRPTYDEKKPNTKTHKCLSRRCSILIMVRWQTARYGGERSYCCPR